MKTLLNTSVAIGLSFLFGTTVMASESMLTFMSATWPLWIGKIESQQVIDRGMPEAYKDYTRFYIDRSGTVYQRLWIGTTSYPRKSWPTWIPSR